MYTGDSKAKRKHCQEMYFQVNDFKNMYYQKRRVQNCIKQRQNRRGICFGKDSIYQYGTMCECVYEDINISMCCVNE